MQKKKCLVFALCSRKRSEFGGIEYRDSSFIYEVYIWKQFLNIIATKAGQGGDVKKSPKLKLMNDPLGMDILAVERCQMARKLGSQKSADVTPPEVKSSHVQTSFAVMKLIKIGRADKRVLTNVHPRHRLL